MFDRIETRQDIEARARREDAFRAALRHDARAALAAAGTVIPDGVEVRVVEETAQVWYLVLPPAAPTGFETDVLSDEELGLAAGGSGWGGEDPPPPSDDSSQWGGQTQNSGDQWGGG